MHPRLLTATARSRRWLGGVVAASAALAGVAAVPQSAHSEVSEACPQPYPVADLVKGAAVTGLTVTQGETPEEFGGSVIGVLEDGIAPGIPMVLVDVESPAVDKAGISSPRSWPPPTPPIAPAIVFPALPRSMDFAAPAMFPPTAPATN